MYASVASARTAPTPPRPSWRWRPDRRSMTTSQVRCSDPGELVGGFGDVRPLAGARLGRRRGCLRPGPGVRPRRERRGRWDADPDRRAGMLTREDAVYRQGVLATLAWVTGRASRRRRSRRGAASRRRRPEHSRRERVQAEDVIEQVAGQWVAGWVPPPGTPRVS